MTTVYIEELAKQVFGKVPKELEADLGKHRARDPHELAQQLRSNALIQAKLAWLFEYTPSKWLLENELEEVKKRREALNIGKKKTESSQGSNTNQSTDKNNDVYNHAAELRLMGLCFSGGGIRSATFNLGILQGLAEHKLLRCFDYLSSVSGGGYIHQWLTAWISRKEHQKEMEALEAKVEAAPEDQIKAIRENGLSEDEKKAAQIAGFEEVNHNLVPLPEPTSPQSHPEPLRWLRRYSNYLTPEKGIFSLDTWVTAAIWLRNTLLNQIILISSLLFVMLLPHLFTFSWFVPSSHWAVLATIAVIVYLFLAAVALLQRELSRLQDSPAAHPPGTKPALVEFMGQSGVQFGLVLPVLLAGILITSLFPIGVMGIDFIWAWILVPVLYLVLTLVITFAGGTLTAYLKAHHFIGSTEKAAVFWARTTWKCLARWRFIGVVGLLILAAFLVALAGAAWHLLMRVMTLWLPGSLGNHLWPLELVIAPPLLLMGPILAGIILIGLIGRIFKDSRREWLGRIGACVAYDAVIWVVFVGGSLFGLAIFNWLTCKIWAGIPALVAWIGTSLWSVLAGKSDKTAGSKDDKAPSSSVLEIVAKVGPYVFVAGLLILLSALAEVIIRGHDEKYFLVALGAAACICLIFTWRVDINEFSMHAYYRDRLARCYLGASNSNRQPNPFTGFDDVDSEIAVSDLKASLGYYGPYPIFCTTLNLTFGEDLAWQERKGASFVFTPVFSGYDFGWTEAKPGKGNLRFNGFAQTATYAYSDPGIHVSTAAAISGAAVSPNWGYHTNPATAFLLTMFNVRLGWWLLNPRRIDQDGKRLDQSEERSEKAGLLKDPYLWPSPRISLLALTNELLGRTNDTSKYLYLTDGGHFDNMGLYELVRRRCRYIVICDGEEDGKLTFEGIGMAIRKCRIDFGAEVSLDLRPLQHAEGENSSTHCVVGTIRYPEDRGKSEEELGIVVYVKSSLTGDEPADLLNYKRQDPFFPHDSTINQWFTESQFESYRRLGHHVADVIFNAGSPDDLPCSDLSHRVAYFKNLKKIWSAFTPEMQQHSAEHSKTYGEMLQKIRADNGLPGFFELLFDRSHKPKDWKAEHADKFDYAVGISSELIEFMHIIYMQLNLVYPENLRHPFAQGWMDIFKSWATIDVIRSGWGKYGPGYTLAFQIFARKEIKLRKLHETEKAG